MNSRLFAVSTTSSAGDSGDKPPHPLVRPSARPLGRILTIVLQDAFADGEGIKFDFVCQPPRLPMHHAPLSELRDGAIDLAHPVVFVKTARNRIVPVRGRGGHIDGAQLEEIFTVLRLDELRADMEATVSRALEVTAEMEEMAASGRNRDDPLLVAKGFLVLTLLQKAHRQLRFKETLEQRLESLRQQSNERVRRLRPGAASWPPGDPHPF